MWSYVTKQKFSLTQTEALQVSQVNRVFSKFKKRLSIIRWSVGELAMYRMGRVKGKQKNKKKNKKQKQNFTYTVCNRSYWATVMEGISEIYLGVPRDVSSWAFCSINHHGFLTGRQERTHNPRPHHIGGGKRKKKKNKSQALVNLSIKIAEWWRHIAVFWYRVHIYIYIYI